MREARAGARLVLLVGAHDLEEPVERGEEGRPLVGEVEQDLVVRKRLARGREDHRRFGGREVVVLPMHEQEGQSRVERQHASALNHQLHGRCVLSV